MRITGASLLAVVVVSVGSAAGGSIVRRMGLDEMTRAADLIVRGKVEAASSRYDDPPDEHRIVTDVTVRVQDCLAGDPGRTGFLTVTVLGGVVEGRGQWVPGAPRMSVGDDVVLFLRPARVSVDGKPRRTVIGLSQGVFFLSRDPTKGKWTARRRLGGLSMLPEAKGPAAESGMKLEDLIRIVHSAGRSR
ncbi:MAG: hypothetical protein GXP54_07430 [Deltaproteobacteria bacterium]|nr:hypothetical protein [Deltaproteobacteria bacterium]